VALIRYVSLSGANGAAVLSDLAVPLRETKPVRNLHLRSARLSVAASARNGSRVLNGIFYILWTGCQWKAMPKDFPPESTVHGTGTTPWSGSITNCTLQFATSKAEKRCWRG
jgi:transposase